MAATNILLVDDNEANLTALEAVLAPLGQNLVKARSGEEALRSLLREDFAVILLDVQMPALDGFETATLIRGRERSRDTPIIFLTGHEAPGFTPAQAYTLGAVDYLLKPVSPVVLRAKVEIFVKLFQRAEQVRQLERQAVEREALAELNRQKDQFLAMLAHELRNPLAPILNGLHILRQEGTRPEERDRTRDMMQRQTEHLARLVDDLLDVSRITRGKVQLRKERLDLAGVVRTATEDRRPTLERAGLRLLVETPETPVWVQGDATRLAQILNNLLDNAAKFSNGGKEVSVRVAADAENGRAVLSVRDQGVGIEPGMLSRLFEPFVQADRSLERTRGGLGLGLPLVKGLAELHGGTAEAASAGPGGGAEFTVRLPLENEPAALSEEHPSVTRVGQHLRVLVVEDNRDAADSLRLLLELLGHEVRVAYTGPAGVEAASAWRPDVVLCDIGLPGLDGYGVARELRLNPTTAQVRLLALTGYGQEEDRRRSRAAGFDQHLVKPADPAELLRLLDHG